jgi:hypothetical protein
LEPSFNLSKRGRIWWASTTLPTGNEKNWTTGEYSKEEAEKKAKKWCENVHRSSRAGMKGGKMHGRHRSKRKEAIARAKVEGDPPVARGPKPVAPKKVAPPRPPAKLEAEPDPEVPPDPPAAAAAAAPEGTPVDAERAQKISEKLRSLGDAPDPAFDEAATSSPASESGPEYFEPGAAPAEGEPGENEAGDLLADVIALGIVAGTVRGVSRACKKATPPRRAGEPNEKMLEWYHAGLRHHIRKMVGNAGALGPTGKMFVGCAGVMLTMLWGSEAIDPPAAAAAAPPRAAPHANGVHRDPPEAPPATPPASTSTEIVGLGRFV